MRNIVIAMCTIGLATAAYYAWTQKNANAVTADITPQSRWEKAEKIRLVNALDAAKGLTVTSSYEEVQEACVKLTVGYVGQDSQLRVLKGEAEIYVDRILDAAREIVVKGERIPQVRQDNEPKIEAAKIELLRISAQVASLIGQS